MLLLRLLCDEGYLKFAKEMSCTPQSCWLMHEDGEMIRFFGSSIHLGSNLLLGSGQFQCLVKTGQCKGIMWSFIMVKLAE